MSDLIYNSTKPLEEFDVVKKVRQKSGDLISRQSAINAIENTDCELTLEDWDELTDALMELPSAERTGEWLWEGFNIVCSECDSMPMFDSTEPLYNYCPNCGARMKGEQND